VLIPWFISSYDGRNDFVTSANQHCCGDNFSLVTTITVIVEVKIDIAVVTIEIVNTTIQV